MVDNKVRHEGGIIMFRLPESVNGIVVNAQDFLLNAARSLGLKEK